MKLPAGYATATIFEAPPKPAEKQKEKQQEPQKQAAPTAAVEKKEEKKPEPVVVPDSPVKPAAGAEKKKSTTYLERISTPEAQYAAAGVAIKEAQAVDKAASVAIGHRKLTPAELEDQEKLKKNVAKGEGKYAAKDTLLADIVNRVLNPNGWLNDTVCTRE